MGPTSAPESRGRSPDAAPLSRWDHTRALLVAVHVVAVLGGALPSPEGFRRDDALEQRPIAGAVKEWERSLGQVGVPGAVTRAVILHGGRTLETVEDAVEEVFQPYSRFAGTRQSWRMFSQVPAATSRMEVWVRSGEEWRVVYRPFDPEARWRADLWEDGRVRGLVGTLGGKRFTAWWQGLAESMARRAAVDFPDGERLRLQRMPLTIPAPGELRASGVLEVGEPVGIVEIDLVSLR